VVASEEATFGLPEVTRGLVAAAGGLLRLPARIPYHIAMEIALTGDRFPARRLHAAGLDFVVAPEPMADGNAVHRLGAHYAVALYAFVEGVAGRFQRRCNN